MLESSLVLHTIPCVLFMLCDLGVSDSADLSLTKYKISYQVLQYIGQQLQGYIAIPGL